MKVFDEKLVTLNNGNEEVSVLVYLKEVLVRNNHKNIKAFCKITGDK